MTNLKRPELKLVGNVSENFKNFELRFNDYCIQANYGNLAKDPVTERADHYKSPLLEISTLRSSLPDEALSVHNRSSDRHRRQKETMGLDGETTRPLHRHHRELTSHRPFQVLDVVSSLA